MDIARPHSSSARTHVTDPRLVSVLDVSDQARTAALHFLDVSSKAALAAQSSAPDISHALAITRAQKPVFAYLTQLRARNRDMAYLIRDDKTATTASVPKSTLFT